MRRFQIILLLVFGGLAAFFQFKQIKEWSLFLDDFSLGIIFLVISCILTIVSFFNSLRLFKQKQPFYVFLPPFVGLVLVIAVSGHRFYQEAINKRRTLFQAMNDDIGSDGGFRFDFKEGGYLQGTKVDRFSTTYYWGKFKRQKDTLLLDIPLDFNLGRRAYLQNNILRFQDDTTKFTLYAPQPLLPQD